MIVKKAAVTAGVAVAAMGLGAGVSHAAPEFTPPPAAAPVATSPLPFHDVASRQETDRAFSQFGSQVGIAVTVGSLAGTVAGAGIGCVVSAAAGCIPGAVTGAGIGAVIGTIVAGGPTLAVSAWQLYETYNAAPGTSVYAGEFK
ncbi:MAG: hypothetical protein WAW17_29920 [Rhodococcus sp. (in: high G+C Gram-positive bacteria)]|uniref:hypothetical protein n=1 Tax=Rhodococcus sp. TaxID=1831 RepID=UPI003BAEB3EE